MGLYSGRYTELSVDSMFAEVLYLNVLERHIRAVDPHPVAGLTIIRGRRKQM